MYKERFATTYGPLTGAAMWEVRKLIACGSYKNGFRRHTCLDCGTVLVVPFTCKSRLCLSCYRKKIFGWSIHLSYIMNPELSHYHVTFTLPGEVRKRLFERGFKVETLIKEAANTYWKELRESAGDRGKEWSTGIMATIHVCGNGLNYNPHVHLIGARELINTVTGEMINVPFLGYKRIRFSWMDAVLRLLRKTGIYCEVELTAIKDRYKNGFHVHFKPIIGTESEVLFRTAEYLASGYFHNSQIIAVDHAKKTVTFKYKSWLDARTKEKSYKTITMDIYEPFDCAQDKFMAKMLYFLPKKHQKMIRYYGIYAHGAGEKLQKITNATWKAAIEHSFDTDPEQCPDCGAEMMPSVIYGYHAEKVWYRMRREYFLYKGYFRQMKRGP